MSNHSVKFHEDFTISFWVILLTDSQTNKQTHWPRWKHNLFGGIRNCYVGPVVTGRQWTCIAGALGIVWSVLWLFLTADTPSQHPRIDPKERDYIEQSQGLLAAGGGHGHVSWDAPIRHSKLSRLRDQDQNSNVQD